MNPEPLLFIDSSLFRLSFGALPPFVLQTYFFASFWRHHRIIAYRFSGFFVGELKGRVHSAASGVGTMHWDMPVARVECRA